MVVSVKTELNLFFEKLKIELLCDPTIPFWGMYPKEWKARSQVDICPLIFIAALFTTARR